MFALIVVFMIETEHGLMPDRQIVEKFRTAAECQESRKQYVMVGENLTLLHGVPIPNDMLYCTARYTDDAGGVRRVPL